MNAKYVGLELAVLLIASSAIIIVGALTFSKNSKSATNRLFGLLSLGLVGWSVANFFSITSQVPSTVYLSVQFVFSFVVLENTALFLLIYAFPGKRININKNFLYSYLALSAFVLVAPHFGLIFNGYSENGNGINPIVGPGLILFVLHALISVVGGLRKLFLRYSKSRGIEKSQLRYLIVATSVLWIFVPFTNFILPLFWNQQFFIVLSPIYTLIFALTIAYAIATQRLFDIRFIVARSLTYIFLLATLAGLYATAFFGIANIFFPEIQASILQGIINTALAIVLAFTFQPLRHFFEQVTDKVFFRDHYDPQVVLNEFSKVLVSELDLDKILSRSVNTIASELHIEFAQLAIFDNDRIYRIENYGQLPDRLMVGPEIMKLDRSLIVADELNGGLRKELMDEHGVRVSLMLRTREQFVGYLLLGDKLSGETYHKQDIEVLEIMVKQLSVAILNAKAYVEIQEFNQTLQARVDHVTSRIRVANRHLKELDKAKDEFISMASHQLRTPLTTIKGYLSMMLDGDAGEITPTQRQFVDYAFGASERMVNLISDLLNVSRLSAGRFLIQTKPTDMVAMVQDEVRQLMTHATAKNIQLIFDQPEKTLPLVEIDENKTRQVVMNFIDNAIYYTNEGAVTLKLEQTGDMVRLEIHDTGIGVPEKAKKKLFSKFFRAENAQTVRPDGTGLGLYLARRVINDQGGTIIFESVEGKGSTFGFELPLKAVIQPKIKG